DRSPLAHAGDIRRPVLMAQGARDARVSHNDADALASALRLRHAPFIYIVYPDEGHGLSRWQNRLSFFAVAETFLGQCLSGRTEPFGHSFDGGSLQAFDGAARMPALTPYARHAPTTSAPETTTTGTTTDGVEESLSPTTLSAPEAPPAAPTSTVTSASPASA